MNLQDRLNQVMADTLDAETDDESVQPKKRRRLQDVLNEIETVQQSSPLSVTEDFTPKPRDPNALPLPPEELDLFNYERTAAAAQAVGAPIDDVLSDEELLVDYVPEYLRPFVRVVAKGADGAIVKPTIRSLRSLNVGLTAAGETTTDAMAAFTQAG